MLRVPGESAHDVPAGARALHHVENSRITNLVGEFGRLPVEEHLQLVHLLLLP